MSWKIVPRALFAALVAVSFAVASPMAMAQQAPAKKETPKKTDEAQKKGADKCAKLTDPAKKQACIAQEAKAKKEPKKTEKKAEKKT